MKRIIARLSALFAFILIFRHLLSVWTSPRTWTTGELVTKTIMDTHVRDNLLALKDPSTKLFTLNQGSNYTTTSTTFTNVDNTVDTFNLTLTTYGGDVLIVAVLNVLRSASPTSVYFDVELDGARIGGDDGIVGQDDPENTAPGSTITLIRLHRSLAAGSHTFKLQWKLSAANTTTIYAGAGTANADLHGQFWVREVS